MEGECSCFDGGDKRAAAIADVGAAAGTPGMVLDIYSVACFQVMSGEFWSRQ
jgi:16S rRNA G527 N7-methylase RsmG